MTSEEALNNLKTHFGWARRVLTGYVGRLFMDSVDELMTRGCLYRWHDLRKDPDDLPSIDEEVLIRKDGKVEEMNSQQRVAWRYHGHWEYSGGVIEHDVIAWRYIEPFEEVTE